MRRIVSGSFSGRAEFLMMMKPFRESIMHDHLIGPSGTQDAEIAEWRLQVRLCSLVTEFQSRHCEVTVEATRFQSVGPSVIAASWLSCASRVWPSSIIFAARNSWAARFALSSPIEMILQELFYTTSDL